jgi:two-component system OmpR family sensor kinase
MKINLSLENKLHIFFIIILIVISTGFFFIQKEIKHKNYIKTIRRYTPIIKYIHKNRLNYKESLELLNSIGFKQVKNCRKFLKKYNFKIHRRNFNLFFYKDKIYLFIRTPFFEICVQKPSNIRKTGYFLYAVFFMFLIILIFIYFLIIKNIREKELLLNSRNLFLRTIMHELKTPIAKGKIVSELVNDEKQKKRLIKIFDKLNYLINDFAKAEQVISKNYHLNKTTFTLKELSEKAFSVYLLEKKEIENITVSIDENTKIKGDIELLSLALKNLIDNGLKYSKDHKIIIKQVKNRLLFISKGNRLPKPLKSYFNPFHNDIKTHNHGMGLGLYIVFSILKFHNMKLDYRYENGQNIFIIEF